jgi:DNA-binding MarR family transcriptional regulator
MTARASVDMTTTMFAAMLDAEEGGLVGRDYTSSTIETLMRRGWIRVKTVTQRGHSRTSVYELTEQGKIALREIK